MIRELVDNLYSHGITGSPVCATFLPDELVMGESAASLDKPAEILFEIPDSCLEGLADFDAGRVVDFQTALQAPPTG